MTDEMWLATALILLLLPILLVPYELARHGGGLRRMGYNTDWRPVSSGIWVSLIFQQTIIVLVTIVAWLGLLGLLGQ